VPKSKQVRIINDMSNDEIAYTVPWALFKAHWWGPIYIRRDLCALSHRKGDVSLRIKKLVDIVLVDRKTLGPERLDTAPFGEFNGIRVKFAKF
jgi:hypothetical protein